MLNHDNFINIAIEIAKWSKCVSKKVWSIIVKDNRILSTWYNWTPSWYINCDEFWWWVHKPWIHWDWSSKYEIHAEMNAILWAARNWVKIDWASVYCTYQPCYDCTKNLIWAWIKNIYYKEKWKKNLWDDLEQFIIDNNVESIQI